MNGHLSRITRAQKYEQVVMTTREMLQGGLVPPAMELEILRRALIKAEKMWVWREIQPLLKGRLTLRPHGERRKYLY